MSRNSFTTERALKKIERQSNKKQKESEERGGGLNSHKPLKMRGKKTALKQQISGAAMSQGQGLFMTVTPATSQSRGTGKTPPSATGSEHVVLSDSEVFMVSPYRDKAGSFPRVTFSKELLIRMNHNKRHLEIDLFRPASEPTMFPLQDLSPLCLYRELRGLKITGMMQNYQSMLWLVVWLNPQLTDLSLEMAGEAEPLDVEAIVKGQEYAKQRPTMREVVQGKTTTEVLDKFHIVNLSLTNFVVEDAPFQWFSDTTLQKVELHRCKGSGFQMPSIMDRSFNIIVIA